MALAIPCCRLFDIGKGFNCLTNVSSPFRILFWLVSLNRTGENEEKVSPRPGDCSIFVTSRLPPEIGWTIWEDEAWTATEILVRKFNASASVRTSEVAS